MRLCLDEASILEPLFGRLGGSESLGAGMTPHRLGRFLSVTWNLSSDARTARTSEEVTQDQYVAAAFSLIHRGITEQRRDMADAETCLALSCVLYTVCLLADEYSVTAQTILEELRYYGLVRRFVRPRTFEREAIEAALGNYTLLLDVARDEAGITSREREILFSSVPHPNKRRRRS